MKKVKSVITMLILFAFLGTTPAMAQNDDGNRTTMNADADDNDDNGKWGLAGLLGLLGLLGLRKKDNDTRYTTTGTTNARRD